MPSFLAIFFSSISGVQPISWKAKNLLITNCKFATSINSKNSRLHNTFMYSYRKNVDTQRKGIHPPAWCSMQCTPPARRETTVSLSFLPAPPCVCCLIYKLQQRQQELGASNLLNKSMVGVEGLQCCCLFIHIPDRRPGQYPRSFPSTNLETLLICDAFGIKLKTHVDIQDNGSASWKGNCVRYRSH